MSKEGGEFRRWIMLGTESVYPPITNRILSAYLASEGVQPDEITPIYVPVYTENLIRVDDVMESPKLAE